MPLKSRFIEFLYWTVPSVLLLAFLELGLSLAWENPYLIVNEPTQQHTRFNPKNMIAYAKVNKLYQGDHNIRFAISEGMFVDRGLPYETKEVIAIGGSTTECGLVPEGQRWPDLLTSPALNYGVSGNSSIDGYYNLKYLIQSQKPSPKKAFIMFAVNDLRAYFNKGADGFNINGWKEPSQNNPLAAIDQTDKNIFLGISIKDSALLSFVKYHTTNLIGRSFYSSYYTQRVNQEHLDNLSTAEFNSVLKTFREQFLPAREDVYKSLGKLATKNKIEITFLTQPHAYREDYIPFQNDLRLFPVFEGKKLNLQQTAVLLDELNSQTKQLADIFGHKKIDAANCFDKLPPSELFYDSVHYTHEGSKQFARCVNESS